VQSELERILASAGFCNAERLTRFLRFVTEEALKGHGDRLKEYVLGVEVFDRAEGYDPRTDPIVRVEARRLRAKLQGYYDGEGRDSAVVIDFPKGSYAPVFHTRPKAEAEAPMFVGQHGYTFRVKLVLGRGGRLEDIGAVTRARALHDHASPNDGHTGELIQNPALYCRRLLEQGNGKRKCEQHGAGMISPRTKAGSALRNDSAIEPLAQSAAGRTFNAEARRRRERREREKRKHGRDCRTVGKSLASELYFPS
jgi:hypothetical protein